MSQHRARPVRPRYGRMVLAVAAATITGVALVGGSSGGDDGSAVARDTASTLAPGPVASTSTPVDTSRVVDSPTLHRDKDVPAASGAGRRVVFSEERQRVWLIDQTDQVERTYLVSGSLYDNLDPGTYAVFSRSEEAYGIEDSGTMNYFVRFAEGDNAAIGFHDIPIDDGAPVQSTDQLGTPLSHGCVRQRRTDAIALWDFAPVGTPVVVTA